MSFTRLWGSSVIVPYYFLEFLYVKQSFEKRPGKELPLAGVLSSQPLTPAHSALSGAISEPPPQTLSNPLQELSDKLNALSTQRGAESTTDEEVNGILTIETKQRSL